MTFDDAVITTTFIKPTARRGACIRSYSGSFQIYGPYDHGKSEQANHDAAARDHAARIGNLQLKGYGDLPGSKQARVWVFGLPREPRMESLLRTTPVIFRAVTEAQVARWRSQCETVLIPFEQVEPLGVRISFPIGTAMAYDGVGETTWTVPGGFFFRQGALQTFAE